MIEHRFAQVVPGKVKEQTEGSFINSRNSILASWAVR